MKLTECKLLFLSWDNIILNRTLLSTSYCEIFFSFFFFCFKSINQSVTHHLSKFLKKKSTMKDWMKFLINFFFPFFFFRFKRVLSCSSMIFTGSLHVESFLFFFSFSSNRTINFHILQVFLSIAFLSFSVHCSSVKFEDYGK